MNGRPSASLIQEYRAHDLSIFTIAVTGSGTWTLVNDADGIDVLTSPSGQVIDLSTIEWGEGGVAVRAIFEWIERYF